MLSGNVIAQNVHTDKEFDIDLWPDGLPNTNAVGHSLFDKDQQISDAEEVLRLVGENVKGGRVAR